MPHSVLSVDLASTFGRVGFVPIVIPMDPTGNYEPMGGMMGGKSSAWLSWGADPPHAGQAHARAPQSMVAGRDHRAKGSVEHTEGGVRLGRRARPLYG